MYFLAIVTGLGTAFSFLLAFWAPSCALCDMLRAFSLAAFALSVAQLGQKSANLRGPLAWTIGAGLLASAAGHLMAMGTLGCPLDCKKVELLGLDVRSATFAYFALLAIGICALWRDRWYEALLLSGGVALLFVAPLFLPKLRREGSLDLAKGNLLFVNLSCSKCKQLLAANGPQIQSAGVELLLLGEPEARDQVYSCTANAMELLIAYSKSGAGDIFEFTQHYRPTDVDVRRGRQQSKRSDSLAAQLKVPELPYLVLCRNGSYVGIGTEELLRTDFRVLLEEAVEQLGRKGPTR